MKARTFAAALIAVLPPRMKPFCYRTILGYRIGSRTHIGFSLIDVGNCSIADDVRIGHGNVFTRVGRLELHEHVRIGHLNIVRGGDEVVLEPYVEVLRLNEINSIPEPVTVNPTKPRIRLGSGAVLTTGHKIDFTDEVLLGRRVILGGRNSSIWTHNRQRTAPVSIGDMTYVGSEIRMAPGSSLPERCIVGIGSVITHAINASGYLIAGVPAKPIQPLTDEELLLIERKTRDDLPENL